MINSFKSFCNTNCNPQKSLIRRIKKFLFLFFFSLSLFTEIQSQSHTFASFDVGTLTSGTAGVSTALSTGGITGDYLFFEITADFEGIGGAQAAWSNSIQVELNNGSTVILKDLSTASCGEMSNPDPTTLHWTGVLNKKYIGGGNLTIRFFDNFNDASGPYTSDITNVNITICQPFQLHTFASFDVGTLTSGTAGVSTALSTGGITGDYLFFEITADFVGTGGGQAAWSNSIQVELNNGSTVILKDLSTASCGEMSNPDPTTLHWTGVLNKKYIGGDNLTIRFFDNFNDASGPYTSDITNVLVNIAQVPEPHAFSSFDVGTLTSGTAGVSTALSTGGITGDYLFFEITADFVGTGGGQAAWSNSIQVELNNGSTVILKDLSTASCGEMSNPDPTTLHWTGVLNKKYIGGGNLTIRFFDNFHDASGPYTSDITNVNITIAQCAGIPFVCPSIGAVASSITTVCANAPFDITATGLLVMDGATNLEQDFGIEFKYFDSATTDPYTGGTSIGVVPFGSLTAGNTTASLIGATISSPDPTGFIYAVLSPAPFNPSCRPSASTSIIIDTLPNVTFVAPSDVCPGSAVLTGQGGGSPSGGMYSGPGVTDDTNGTTYSFDPVAAGVGIHTITYSIVGGNGCVGSANDNIQVVDTINPTAVCQNISIFLDGAGNATIVAADVDGGSTDNCGGVTLAASPTAFTCANIGANNVTLTANDGNGNTAMCIGVVTVVDTTSPVAVCQNITMFLDGAGNATIIAADIDNGSTDNCSTLNLAASPTAFTCANIGANNVTLTVNDGSGNSANCISVVTMVDTIAPTVTCPGNQIESPDASCNFTLPDYTSLAFSSDNCTASPTVTQSPVPGTLISGATTITMTANDGNGNSSFCTFDVTLVDATAPTAVCQNINVYLNGAGMASIVAADIDGGSTDNCSGITLSASQTAFTCADIGANNVTLTVTDGSGNAAMCISTVTVADTISPTASCQNITMFLDGAGNTTIVAADLDNGSTDNCTTVTLGASTTAFTCADIGANNVTLTVTDGSGNAAMCTSTVTVSDTISPTASCQNITMFLDGAGNTTIVAADLDNGSTDNCTTVTLAASTTSFTCADLGPNAVTLTLTDGSGNTATCTSTVTVADTISPTASCQNITMFLDGAGNTTIVAADLDNGSTDNCSTVTLAASTTSFTCADLGPNAVTLTLTDGSGNTATCTSTVTVADTIAPTASCQSITVFLDGAGNATIVAADLDNGSTDNCSTVTLAASPTAFTCADLGLNIATLTATDGSGNTATCIGVVTVIDTISRTSFTALGDLCLNSGIQTNLGGGTPTGGVYSGAGVMDDGNGTTYSFDPAVAGVGVHTITYDYTDGNGCADSASDDVEVFALPMVTFTAPADICILAGIQTNLGGGSPTGGVYSGSGVTDDGNGVSYSFDPAAAGLGIHVLSYDFTDINGCSNSATDDIEVVLPPVVTLTIPPSQDTLCIDAGLQVISNSGTPAGGVYSGPGVTDDGNGTSFTFDPVVSGSGLHLITYTYDGGAGCIGMFTDFIQVFDLPIVTFSIPASQDSFCVDAGLQVITTSGAPAGGVYSGPGVTDGGNGTSFTFDPAAAGVGFQLLTYTYTDGNGCTNSFDDFIIVLDLPTVTFTAPADLCVDAGVQAGLGGGSPAGGIYSGSGVTDNGDGMTYDFDPAAAGVGLHTLTYTYTDANGCTDSASDDVEVFALPVVTFTALSDLCVDAGVQAGLGGGTPTGGVYSGPGVTDNGDGMTYDFDPASAGVGVHTLTYTYTDANGCTDSASDDVEVFALPIVTFTALADLCIDAGVQAGLGGGTPTGGVYSGSGVTDDGNGMTYNFDPATAGVGVHTLTYTYTDANGCTDSASDDVEVFALPVVTFTALSDLCVDAGVQAGLGGGTPTGGVYSGSGVTDNGDGMTYDFDPASAGVGVHILTYTYTDANGCTDSASDDVEVFALPIVTFTALADLCIDAGVQAGLGGGTPTGGVYSGPGVTDNGDGMTYDFDPASAGVGVHTLTYTYTDANGCTDSASDDVEVFALPVVTFTAPADLCVDAGVQAGLGGGTPTGGVYSGSGVTDNGDGMTYDFDPASAGVGVHILTYTYTDANGCTDSASDDVEVFALPIVTFTALADLCIDAGVQAGLGGGTPTGGVYSGPGVTDNGDGMTYDFDPVSAGVGVHTLTYTYTDANGCTDSASDDVEVFALPVVTFTAPADLCVDAGVQAGLGGGTPTGGVYSGPGVTDNGNGTDYDFDPASAGVGVHTITYDYTDANGCSNSASDDVEVFALPVITFTALADLCIDAGVQAGLGGGTPTGGVYSGPGVTDNGDGMTYDFDPAAAGVGVHILAYTYTDANGCTASASDDVEVFALPVVTFTALADLCVDAGVQAGLGGGTPTGGEYSGPGVTDDGNGMTYSFDPASAGVGVHTLTYDFTDGNGCTDSASDDVEVFDLPVVTFTALADLCIDAGIQIELGGGTPTGGTYFGPGVMMSGSNTYDFDPSAAGVGVHTITYIYTDANGCTNSASDDVEVFDLPVVTFTAPADLCIDAGIQSGLGGGLPSGAGGIYSGPGVTDDGNGMTYSFDPAVAGVGVHTITYTFTDVNGCTNSASDDVEVFALPVVTFTALADLCVDAGVQAGLGGGTPTGGVYSGPGVTDNGDGMSYDFDPASAGVGVHTLTYTYTDANGCTASASDDVEVFPLPVVTFTALADLCIDSGVQTGLGGGTPTGGVYSGSGVTDNGDGMTYDFDPATAGVGTHTITYDYTDTNGCSGSASDDVEVFALPVVTFTALADLCVDAGVQAGLGGGTPTGGVYSGPGVTDNGDGMTYDFDPAAAGVGIHILTYTYTDGNGCTDSARDGVEVFDLPVVTLQIPDIQDSFCIDAGLQTITGGLPTGGTGSLNIILNGDFENTSSVGCDTNLSDSDFTSRLNDITAFGGGQSELDIMQGSCFGPLAQSGSVRIGLAVAPPNSCSFSFALAQPIISGNTYTISFWLHNNDQFRTETMDVIIGLSDSASMLGTEVFRGGSDVPLSNNLWTEISAEFIAPMDADYLTISGDSPDGGAWSHMDNFSLSGASGLGIYSGPGVTDNGNGIDFVFDPATAGTGVHIITYTYTDGNGCTGFATDTIEVFALPLVTFTGPADLCVDAGVQAGLGGGTPTGGVYSGSGVTDDGNGMTYSFDPAVAGIGVHTITYDYTDVNGCSNSASDDVEVFDLPLVSLVTEDFHCLDADIQNIPMSGGSPSGGVYSGIGITDNGNGISYFIDPTVNGVGTVTVTYTYTDGNGCTNTATSDIEIADCGFSIDDPCNCLDNATTIDLDNGTGGDDGQFSELVSVTGAGGSGLPNGMTWTVVGGSGAFDAFNVPPVGMQSAGVPLATDGSVLLGYNVNSGHYEIPFVHVDGQGYTISVEGPFAMGSAGNVTLSISNNCSYPNPVFDPVLLSMEYCVEDPSIMLGASEPSGFGADEVTYTINGNAATVFDPMALGGGDHVVVMTYDGAADGNGGLAPMGGTAYPGCIQTVTQVVNVNPICCLPPTISCPTDNFGLPMGCNVTPPAAAATFNVFGGSTPDASLPTVAEGCDPMVLTSVDVITDNGCVRTLTRTYRITDDNGDFDECVQTFSWIQDTQMPTFDNAPMDETVECDAIPEAVIVTASDNCMSALSVIFINEIHYDNAGGDVGEFIEVSGSAGYDLSSCELVLYNGSNGSVYNTIGLSGMVDDEGMGYGAVSFGLPANGLQNGAPDGVALVCGGGVIEFISYEGSFTAVGGPADGMVSVDIGVSEGGNTAVGESLQLGGSGCNGMTFGWSGPMAESPGLLNSGQVFDISQCAMGSNVSVVFTENYTAGNMCPQAGELERRWVATDGCGNSAEHIQIITIEDNTAPEFCDAPVSITLSCEEVVPMAPVVTAYDACERGGGSPVWVNEFHYDNSGADVGEFIEIAGIAGTDLSGYSLELYNGNGGTLDETINLSGVIPSEVCGYGALSFATVGLMNGSPDGFALVSGTTVIEFLSYEGSFVAVNGSAAGMMSVDVGVGEPGSDPAGLSLQLSGMGSTGSDFVWGGPVAESPGSINSGQEFEGTIVGVLVENTVPGNCPNSRVITRTWTVSDACGNMNEHVQTITIDDATPPMAVCTDITVQIDQDGNVDIAARDLGGTSSDNCTANEDLLITAERTMFSCLDLIPNTAMCANTIPVEVTVEDECGNVSMCTANVRVEDNVAPILTCPDNKIVSLDAGECEYYHYYVEPFAEDNCEGILSTTFLSTTFIDNNGGTGNMFDVTNTSGGAITITMFDIHLATTAGTMNEAQVWYISNTYVGNETNAGAWTSLGSSMVMSAGPGNPSSLPVGGLVLQPGESYGIYVSQIDGGSDIDYTNGANLYSDANLNIQTGVGRTGAPFTGGLFSPRTWNGNIHYTVVTGNMTEVTQVGGTDLMSGDGFVDGDYSWTYEANDGCGNISSCTFSLQVNNYPLGSTTTTLSCNSVLNVSLSTDCEAIIGADMMLEGGPYRCYSDYIVSVAGQTSNVITEPGTYEVSVMDPDSGNSCWGIINVEDKQAPVVVCPPRDTIVCYGYDALKWGELEIAEPEITDCSDFTSSFSDIVVGDDCEGRLVTRTYIATDITNGKSNSCSFEILVRSLEPAMDIRNPEGLVELNCGGDASPEAIAALYDDPLTKDNINTVHIVENNEGYIYAYPTYMLGGHVQKVDESACNFYATYTDQVLDACGPNCHGNKKIIRTWKYIDWCTQEISEYKQIIKASDNEAPTFITKDTIVSTRPWDCTAEFTLPAPWELHDACDIDPQYYVSGPAGVIITPKPGGGYIASGAPKGKHVFYYTAYDCCDNERTEPVNIVVLDRVSPVVTTDQDVVVSLTPGGPGADGQAKLYTYHFDNGSFDVCTDVHLEVRRADGAPQCGNDGEVVGNAPYNNNLTFNDTDVRFGTGNHPNDNRSDTDGGEFVKFCCEDIEAEQVDANGDGVVDSLDRGYVMVILRVWDDANMSGVYGDEVEPFPGCAPQRDNYNEGWVYVKVEDKLPPIIACPADATIYCDWGIDVSSDFGGGFQNSDQANFDKTGKAEAYSTCGLVDVFFNDNVNVDDCGVGTIIRQWQASTESKTGPKVVTCQQIITVLPRPSQFAVTAPNPTPLVVGCSLTQDDLDRRLPTVVGGACDVIGENVKVDTFLFENGVCKKWVAEYNYYNWCTQVEMGPYYAYFVYEDTEDPVLDDCEDKMFGVDANCETVLTLTNSATDGGGCVDNGWLKWQLFVDTWADGTVNHYASSFVSSSTYSSWKPVAGDDPLLPGGVTYAPVVYVKYVEPTASMGNDEVSVTLDAEVITGKMSNHKVTWKVTDGCHNHVSCSYDVMVVDKKAPTPYCISLSSAVMEDGTVELWAIDFNQGSFDNCSEQEDLWFTFNELSGAFKDTIIRVGNRDYLVNADVAQYFDEDGFVDFDGDGVTYPEAKTSTVNRYNSGDIQKWVPEYNSSSKVFDCDEYLNQGPNGVEVRMSVWDKKCNTDFCIVYLTLVDNQGGCGTTVNNRTISGSITNESGEPIMHVTVVVEGDVNDLTRTQIADGSYVFSDLPKGVNYELRSDKDEEYMNGISTLDLVLIQRHILGLQEIDNAYKLIAADVNMDMRVRANDLVELRKLILGVTEAFTAPSWMVIKADQPMSMNTPLAYERSIYVDNLQADEMSEDFIGIKVGDINGNASANTRSNNSEPRSGKTIHLAAAEQEVVVGSSVSVAITSSNFTNVYGYQFTAEMDGLTLSGVRSGAIEMTGANVGEPREGVLTASWASENLANVKEDEVLFTLDFVATKSGKLSNMMKLSSIVTNAESYTGAGMSVSGIDLRFRTAGGVVANNALYQNEPNPFKDVTRVMYELAEAGEAKFTLYDVTGKVLLVKRSQASKGMNTIEFNAGEINASGIIYYQIESGDYTATKKMLIIE